MKKTLSLLLILLPFALGAQPFSYDLFLQTVARENASYLAEKYNVEIAEANLQAARVFNDPELTVSYEDNDDRRMKMGRVFEAELAYTISLGGVRKARIGVAATEKELSEAALADFFRILREQATLAWGTAWEARERERILRTASETMQRVAAADSVRASLGDIRLLDARESALEAISQKGAWLEAHSEYLNALADLSLLAGGQPVGDLADEELPEFLIPYGAAELMEVAEANRADLKAAELSHKLSQKNLALVRASRAMELGLALAYAHSSEVRNEIAPAPEFNGISVGVTIPLKFSSLNRGERAAAEASVQQAEHYLHAARQMVRTEVAKAWNAWEAACEVATHYSDEIVGNARSILEGVECSYSHGDASLLELLKAIRTFNDVALSTADAQAAKLDATARLLAALGVE